MAFLQHFYSFVIVMRGKRRLDVGQLGYITANRFQIGLCGWLTALCTRWLMNSSAKLHNVVEFGISNFRLDHPEFSQVAACLGFFRAERRAKGIDLAQRHGHGFDVKLA